MRSMSRIAALHGVMVALYMVSSGLCFSKAWSRLCISKAWLGLYLSVGVGGVEGRDGMGVLSILLLRAACNREGTSINLLHPIQIAVQSLSAHIL